jgi:hypothetical protein
MVDAHTTVVKDDIPPAKTHAKGGKEFNETGRGRYITDAEFDQVKGNAHFTAVDATELALRKSGGGRRYHLTFWAYGAFSGRGRNFRLQSAAKRERESALAQS